MKPSILVVEDDAALSELLTWNFDAAGYDVRCTADGEEAMVMVREQMPDLIILDWMIEEVPGIEVIRRLRRDKETARVPVIMLTGLDGEVLSFADIELDPASHRVRRGGASLHLGPTEFKLLRYFMERPGRVVSRQQILDSVWGVDSEIDERTVDVHIRRLRKAIVRPGEDDPIRTVRAAGYAMDTA
jgi:two-component system, OmpR family, phosphate regulon response regulator PhoB